LCHGSAARSALACEQYVCARQNCHLGDELQPKLRARAHGAGGWRRGQSLALS
jgi:phosphoribosyl-dephospho-CoA transferase